MTVYAEDIEIGQSASYTRTVAERDIQLFGEATGDMNPVHFDEAYAATTPFKTRIAHGMLTAGFFSTVLGTKLPGAGSIYVSQTLSFKAPVRIGDTVTGRVEVLELNAEKNRVRIKTTCTNQEGVIVLSGEGLVSPPKVS